MIRWFRRRAPETSSAVPNPVDLWEQAKGDRAEYERLLAEHGIIPLPAPLPRGWPKGTR